MNRALVFDDLRRSGHRFSLAAINHAVVLDISRPQRERRTTRALPKSEDGTQMAKTPRQAISKRSFCEIYRDVGFRGVRIYGDMETPDVRVRDRFVS